MIPALTTPARTETLEQQRAAFWQTKTGNRETEDALLWAAHLRWSLEPGNRDKPLNAFFTFWAEGQGESPGNLINGHDRQRARLAGYSGPLMRLATVGRALRNGLPRSEIDALTTEQLRDKLRTQGLSNLRAGQDALAPRQAHTRAMLKDASPDAPTGYVEADILNLNVLEILPPAVYRAAVHAVQTGEALGLEALAKATRPPRYLDWGKQRAHDLVTGELPWNGQIFDAHHVPIGESEARSGDRPHFLVFVRRGNHIPQPGGPVTAHHRDFSPRNDPEKQRALLYYDIIQRARWEAWIRGEVDPYPVLPPYALMRREPALGG